MRSGHEILRRRAPQNDMIVIGITGSIGTGKSTVARMFVRLGAKLIDADRIAHFVMKPYSNVWKSLVSAFGMEILNRNKTVNRKKLAEIVFRKQPEKLKRLNAIIHPEVARIMLSEIDSAWKTKIPALVIDAALLIEAGLGKVCDGVIVVTAGRKKQEERICVRGKFSWTEMKARLSMQLPLREKEKNADFVVDNSGSLKNTRKQVKKIWEEIK